MNKEWIEQEKIKRKEEILDKIKEELSEIEELIDDDVEKCIEKIKKEGIGFKYRDFIKSILVERGVSREEIILARLKASKVFFDYLFNYEHISSLDELLDSEPVEFDGDIIITDPCYIVKKNEDWEKCSYGDQMENLGVKTYMSRDTIYGDWSCTVYNTDTKETIGEFCADAGMVAVMDLTEVLAYNPEFDYHAERLWTTALIKDFKGIVQFIIEREEYE